MSSAEGTSATVGTLYGGISDARTESSHRSAERTAAEVAARLDRMPASRYFWKVILLVSLGGWFEYYDLIFTGCIAPGLTKSGLLTTTTTTFNKPTSHPIPLKTTNREQARRQKGKTKPPSRLRPHRSIRRGEITAYPSTLLV